MPTLSFGSNAGVVRGVMAKTDYTLRVTVRDPDDAAKTITSYAFRATARIGEGGRVVKTWNTSTGGGITLQSAPSGRIEIAIDDADLPSMPGGTMELVEYSGGALTGEPTDRFRFFFPVLGGPGISY